MASAMHLPQLMAQLAERAMDKDETCERCGGTSASGTCSRCKGKGVVQVPGDIHALRRVFVMHDFDPLNAKIICSLRQTVS